jgi:allantoicase
MQATILLVGWSTSGIRDDVIDLAVICRNVAVVVCALLIPQHYGSFRCPGEQAGRDADFDTRCRREDGTLKVSPVKPFK